MKNIKIEIPEGFEIENFDKETGTISFIPVLKKPITDIIKTVDDAINILGEGDIDVIDLRELMSTRVQEHIISHQQLVVIIKALNEGWTPDWHDKNWNKWSNWFNMSSPWIGRFSFLNSSSRYATSTCSSRLCFKSKELAEYAANQFIEVYRKAFIT